MDYEDETVAFWLNQPSLRLAETAAVMHRDRRSMLTRAGPDEVNATRRAVGFMVLQGQGVEVGAGDRPWPLPPGASCFYGDIRDGDRLATYFKTDAVSLDRILDAQTFAGIPDASFDFVISAHVIEHLQDPIGAIRATMRVLRTGGAAVIAVPDMRHTFDHARPLVTFEHLQADALDGGAGTRLEAYLEHIEFVYPVAGGEPIAPEDRLTHARQNSDQNMDVHFHAWTAETFHSHLLSMAEGAFRVEAMVPVRNEGIFVLRKQ